jgi:tetratricopeptide (TPR) repeat protein
MFMEGGTVKDMETQARDIEFLIKEVAKFPNANANLFEGLAEEYLYTGSKEKAIQHFVKSLELDATTEDAVKRLQQLSNKAGH